MAAQHGIPLSLPALPSLSRTEQNKPDPVEELKTLSKNYLNMLASAPQETSTHQATEAPLDLESMLNDILQENPVAKDMPSAHDMAYPAFANAFTAAQQPFLTSPLIGGDFDPSSPLFGAGNSMDFTSPALTANPNDLTSPFFGDAHDFGTSPLLVDNQFFGDNGGNFNDSLFIEGDSTPPLVNDTSPLLADLHSSPQLSTPLNAVGTYDAVIADAPSLFPSNFEYDPFNMGIQPGATMLPPAPKEDVVAPSADAAPPPPAVKPRRTQNRKVIATGTRRNLTPSSLVSEDAPTQTRSYALPSITSKKDMPVTFARKRAAAAIANDDEDFLPDLPLDATEKEQIEWKRRQNTIAARKSRKRKLEHQQWLEGEVEKLQRDRDLWKVRAITLRGVLKGKGEDGGMEEWDQDDEE